jgi:hypothetical protein
MSTFAFACAEDKGLHLVADGADYDSRWLNSRLGSQGVEQIYEALLHPETGTTAQKADYRDLFEVIVYHHCDASSLTAKQLAGFGEEREPYERLKIALQQMALSIPTMKNEGSLDEALRDAANDALRKWRSDQLKPKSIAREIFGNARRDQPKQILEGLIEKARHAEFWGSFTASEQIIKSFGGHAGGVLAVIGSTAIGVVFHGFSKATKNRKPALFGILQIWRERASRLPLALRNCSGRPGLRSGLDLAAAF